MFSVKPNLNGDPMTAVAKGAINLIDGSEFWILSGINMRFDSGRQNGEFRFHTIIQPGTPYPSDEPVTTLKLRRPDKINPFWFGNL